MIVQMNQYGAALCTRQSGRAAYDEIAKAFLSSREKVTFDFTGVDTVTNSFADEVFGRMAAQLGMAGLRERTSFKNVKPLIAFTIRGAMESRAMDRGGCLQGA